MGKPINFFLILMILGIDFGSSNIDFALIEKQNNKIIQSNSFSSDLKNPNLNSLIKKFPKQKISSVNVTGYGKKFFQETFQGIPVKKINEIEAIAFGAKFVSKEKQFLAASLGSGTCLVSFRKQALHCGGTAIGGKTLLGLGKLLLKENSFKKLQVLASKGSLENIDLTLKDIYPEGIGLLDSSSTASHFGNIKSSYKKQDIALALFNLVAQASGGTAAFAALAHNHKKIVFTGKLAESKTIQTIIRKRISVLDKDLEFIFPKNAGIATALGAALR